MKSNFPRKTARSIAKLSHRAPAQRHHGDHAKQFKGVSKSRSIA